MKNKTLLTLGLLAALNLQLPTAFAQGTAFTYQGRLIDGANPARGSYDLRFSVFDVPSGGISVAGPITNAATSINNGLFTVTLDFGPNIFDGSPRWLQIDVRTNGAGSFTSTSPRAQITPAPYAIFSSSAASMSNGVIRNPFFIGTANNTPLDLYVNSQRALRLTPDPRGLGAPNFIGGFAGNNISANGVGGSVIAGGGYGPGPNRIEDNSSGDFIGAGSGNIVRANVNDAVIVGGYGNLVAAYGAAIGGGFSNNASSLFATVPGGAFNTIPAGADYASIGGGWQNFAYAAQATIGGGQGNVAGNINATIGGGGQNTAAGLTATISGGYQNSALNTDATVAGGYNNLANGYRTTISGGALNLASGNWGSISGGQSNGVLGDLSSISGGEQNLVNPNAHHGNINGGWLNTLETNSTLSSIGGGYGNVIAYGTFYLPNNPQLTNFSASVIGGGFENHIGKGGLAVIGGGGNNAIGDFSSYSIIGGGTDNTIASNGAACTIGGGLGNTVGAHVSYGTIAGGAWNSINANANSFDYGYSTVGGGNFNGIGTNTLYTTICGGSFNVIRPLAVNATIGGGGVNTVGGLSSTVAGGYANRALATDSTVSGGYTNTASGYRSTVPGGTLNVAAGDYSLAAGNRAKADDAGAFVWADANNFDFHSFTSNQFAVRCTGGAKFVTAIDAAGGQTAGVRLQPGDTAWSSISDRHAKKNFTPVDAAAVLEKLAAMPVESWNYKWEADTNTPHLGPMAQDFKAAFYPGRDDKTISTLEFDGIELAAIQGLNKKVEEQRAENAELKRELSELKKIVQQIARQRAE